MIGVQSVSKNDLKLFRTGFDDLCNLNKILSQIKGEGGRFVYYLILNTGQEPNLKYLQKKVNRTLKAVKKLKGFYFDPFKVYTSGTDIDKFFENDAALENQLIYDNLENLRLRRYLKTESQIGALFKIRENFIHSLIKEGLFYKKVFNSSFFSKLELAKQILTSTLSKKTKVSLFMKLTVNKIRSISSGYNHPLESERIIKRSL